MKRICLLITILVLVLSPVRVSADTGVEEDVPNTDVPNPDTGMRENLIAIGSVLVIGSVVITIKTRKNKNVVAKI